MCALELDDNSRATPWIDDDSSGVSWIHVDGAP
jgi:hypothetical protein